MTGSSGLLGWGWPEPREGPTGRVWNWGLFPATLTTGPPLWDSPLPPASPPGFLQQTHCAGSQAADERAGPDLPAQEPPACLPHVLWIQARGDWRGNGESWE